MTDRSCLAAALDLVDHIRRYVTDFDGAEHYRSEIETQAVAQIRRSATSIDDRMWKRAAQATDLLNINRNGRDSLYRPEPDPELRWRRFWEARDGYCMDFLDVVTDTLELLVANLEALAVEAGELVEEMGRVEPRAVPVEGVPTIAAELVVEWRAVLAVTRIVADERFERGVRELTAAATPVEVHEALRTALSPEHDAIARLRLAQVAPEGVPA